MSVFFTNKTYFFLYNLTHYTCIEIIAENFLLDFFLFYLKGHRAQGQAIKFFIVKKYIYTRLTLNLYKYFYNCLIEILLCVLETLLYVEIDKIIKIVTYHIVCCKILITFYKVILFPFFYRNFCDRI